jgi:hypothetical protein
MTTNLNQHMGRFFPMRILLTSHISYLTTYPYSLSNSASNEYKLDGIWTTFLFGDEVVQVMMWQVEVANHVGPTRLNMGLFSPKTGPTKSLNTC